jgi:hypothetical protein
MNSEIEARLQALQPAAPPADLRNRLLESEPPQPGKIHWLRRFAPLAAAAAAVAALMALSPFRARHPAKPQPAAASTSISPDFRVFVPIQRTSTLVDVHNIAVLDSDSARPVRFIRATWMDDTTYAGDDGHSTLRRREPRTAILSVPLDAL